MESMNFLHYAAKICKRPCCLPFLLICPHTTALPTVFLLAYKVSTISHVEQSPDSSIESCQLIQHLLSEYVLRWIGQQQHKGHDCIIVFPLSLWVSVCVFCPTALLLVCHTLKEKSRGKTLLCFVLTHSVVVPVLSCLSMIMFPLLFLPLLFSAFFLFYPPRCLWCLLVVSSFFTLCRSLFKISHNIPEDFYKLLKEHCVYQKQGKSSGSNHQETLGSASQGCVLLGRAHFQISWEKTINYGTFLWICALRSQAKLSNVNEIKYHTIFHPIHRCWYFQYILGMKFDELTEDIYT